MPEFVKNTLKLNRFSMNLVIPTGSTKLNEELIIPYKNVGKLIQEIQAETNSTIVIEEVDDFGIIDIVTTDKESSEAAKARIKAITAVPEVGEVYLGTVKNITNFGAFIEIIPNKEGLLHISEIDWKHIKDVESVLKTGDKVKVKLIDIDSKTGKLKLSRKVLIPKPERK